MWNFTFFCDDVNIVDAYFVVLSFIQYIYTTNNDNNIVYKNNIVDNSFANNITDSISGTQWLHMQIIELGLLSLLKELVSESVILR